MITTATNYWNVNKVNFAHLGKIPQTRQGSFEIKENKVRSMISNEGWK